jgi:hypothetical protein
MPNYLGGYLFFPSGGKPSFDEIMAHALVNLGSLSGEPQVQLLSKDGGSLENILKELPVSLLYDEGCK